MRLRSLPRSEADALVLGQGAPPAGLGWDVDYPSEATLDALGLLRLAHGAAGTTATGDHLPWWLHQIVVTGTRQDLIVGDIGFHGPPASASPAVVEIGYHVVPGWRTKYSGSTSPNRARVSSYSSRIRLSDVARWGGQ